MVGGMAHALLALAGCIPLALREARVFTAQAGSAAELAEAGAAAACGINPMGSAAALGKDGGRVTSLCFTVAGECATPRGA